MKILAHVCPKALKLVGHDTISMAQKGWLGIPDVDWLTKAGRSGWLVFSANKKMLKVPTERDIIVRERVGIVFLTNGEEHVAKVLKLMLTKWKRLEDIDRNTARPLAYFLSPNGRISTKFRNISLQGVSKV